MCTKFQRNLKWIVIFHVEHFWNDPNVSLHIAINPWELYCIIYPSRLWNARFVDIAPYLIGPQHSLGYEGWLPTSYTIHLSLRGDYCTESKVCFSAALPVVSAHKD